MGRFHGLINQNVQQPPKAESKRPENVNSKSSSQIDTNNAVKQNNEEDEELKQDILWSDAEKKHPWYDAPPKVKVTTKNGLCHMKIEFTVGMTPDGFYEVFTNPYNIPIFIMGKSHLLENKSRKVLKKDGPIEIVKVEKDLALDFLWWSGSIPINLTVDENKKDFTGKYKKEKMMFMKVFEGNWKIEPLYVDSKRLCNNIVPKSREEYKQCSGGKGRIGSKVTMNQYFQPYFPLNLPPISWYVRMITIKTTKTLLQMFQYRSVIIREVSASSQDEVIKSTSS